MSFIISLLITAVAVLISAYIVPGVSVDSFGTSILVALVLAVLNAVIKPILLFLTLPINILTLGLFSLVISVLILLIAANLVTGFQIDGFFSALLFGFILSLVVGVLGSVS